MEVAGLEPLTPEFGDTLCIHYLGMIYLQAFFGHPAHIWMFIFHLDILAIECNCGYVTILDI